MDSVSAGLNNLAGSPPEPTSIPTLFTGGIGLGWGPKSPEITFPEFLGIDPIREARIVNITMDISTDWSAIISGTGKLNIYKDDMVAITGGVVWDYIKDTVTISGGVTALGGLVSGTASTVVSQLGVTGHGQVAASLPNGKPFGPLGGITVGLADFHIQYVEDTDTTNDFKAVWGQVLLPVIGALTVGYKQNLNTQAITPILSANDIPKTNSYDVDGTEDWLMISALWDNAATGPVLTRVRTPEGTFIAEADYAANGITLVASLTNAFAKTIVIDNPRAGNWDLQVVDATGLGVVEFKGYSPNTPVAVVVSDASTTVGALTGQITAEISGADMGTHVTFWADTDGTGFDGLALGGVTVNGDGTITHTFDTRLLSTGNWQIYAMADDGRTAPAFDYLETPLAIAHLLTGITLDPATAAEGVNGVVEETSAPGTLVGTISVQSNDRGEAHVLTLLDTAGGRFVLDGARLLVATGAPLQTEDGPYTLTLRATGPTGQSIDQEIRVAAVETQGTHSLRSGVLASPEVILGTQGDDIFLGAGRGDRLLGQGGNDGLWLSGARADFEVIFDLTGSLLGPLSGNLTGGLGSSLGPALPGPYVQVRALGAPTSDAITASGIEFIQFADQRVQVPAQTAGQAFVDSYDVVEDMPLHVAAPVGLLSNDGVPAGASTIAILDSAPAHGTLVLAADGSFTYTPDQDFFGSDAFTYRTQNGALLSDPARVLISVQAQLDPPTIISLNGADSASLTVVEGQDRLPSVIAIDPDGDLLEYFILGPDRERFTFDPVSGALSFVTAPVFATPQDAGGDNVYDIEMLVQGNGQEDTQLLSITVTQAPVRVTFTGTAGSDSAATPGGAWTATGLAGNDTLLGGNGEDILDGGLGNDSLIGSAGTDSLLGGDGNDTLDGGADWDILDGGAGVDTASYASALGPVSADLGAGIGIAGDAMGDLLVGIENLTGSGFDDTLSGSAAANLLQGGAGDDTLAGQAGNDTLSGAAGADVLDGGAGVDIAIFDNSPSGVNVSLATGTGLGGDAQGDTLRGIENLRGSAHADLLAGDEGANTLLGENGNDTLNGEGGDDTLLGGDGGDLLTGGAGNDRLDGGTGNDTLDGGDGLDTLIGGAGNDTLNGGTSSADLRDVIFGGDGDDMADAGHGNDELRGDGGNDTLNGGFGADTLIGGEGADNLVGGPGSDAMFGGPGNDTLNGGFGFDRLNGGTGADRFFHLGVVSHGSDWLQDYSATDGDTLVFGQAGATRSQFQVNFANTPTAGSADLAEAFIIHRPTGQIIWALVDGAGQQQINIELGGNVFDLLS